MRSILFITVISFLAYGLWAHDWSIIVSALTLAVVWPLVAADVKRHTERELLDRLWADDDLSESA
jgi:hypothetical protein